jgi:hypothetical protein
MAFENEWVSDGRARLTLSFSLKKTAVIYY